MQFSMHREELMSLLRQVSLFTSETSHSVRFSFETGQLHLSVMSAEVGEGRVSMPVDYAGERLDIAFNPHFFIDILRHSKDETIRFGLIDSHNPGLVTDSTTALFVIMPMRLNELAESRRESSHCFLKTSVSGSLPWELSQIVRQFSNVLVHSIAGGSYKWTKT